MNELRYKQCTLKNGTEFTTGYIPEYAARVGAFVELKSLDDQFWEVTSVPVQSISEEIVKANERNYKLFQKSTRSGGID